MCHEGFQVLICESCIILLKGGRIVFQDTYCRINAMYRKIMEITWEIRISEENFSGR